MDCTPTSLRLCLSRLPIPSTMLNPMVKSQSSCHLNSQQHLAKLINPLLEGWDTTVSIFLLCHKLFLFRNYFSSGIKLEKLRLSPQNFLFLYWHCLTFRSHLVFWTHEMLTFRNTNNQFLHIPPRPCAHTGALKSSDLGREDISESRQWHCR